MRIHHQPLLAAAIGSVLFVLPRPAASQFRDSVWVNSRSGVYHCPGTQYYGRTTSGEYQSEGVARERGFRANGGRLCHPGTAAPSGAGGPGSPLPDEPRFTREARECVLTRIIDGDSIECSPLGPVRLIGTDSPEADQPPFGTAATAGLASLVPSGATLRLELDAEERDQYGRVLAYAWYDARMINWLMVRHGWSVSYRYPPNVRYAAVLDSAEAAARREARGLWLVDGFRCRPAERRQRVC